MDKGKGIQDVGLTAKEPIINPSCMASSISFVTIDLRHIHVQSMEDVRNDGYMEVVEPPLEVNEQ